MLSAAAAHGRPIKETTRELLVTIWKSGALIVLGLAMLTPPVSRAQTAPDTARFGLYVVAQDVERSAVFYERLFGRAPQVRTPALVGFDVSGGLYAVVSRRVYAPDAVKGDATLPYIKVDDIDAWFAHVRTVAPDSLVGAAITREGPFSFFKLRDPDGNLVEFYSISTGASPPKPR